jgi:hypothetical protein
LAQAQSNNLGRRISVKCENFALTLLFLSITQTKGPCGDPGQEGNIVSIHTKDLTSGNAAKCELLEAWRAVANAKLMSIDANRGG